MFFWLLAFIVNNLSGKVMIFGAFKKILIRFGFKKAGIAQGIDYLVVSWTINETIELFVSTNF